MTRLIIPDIHEQDEKLKAILKEFDWCESRTFLGDYLDSFTGTPNGIVQWLKENIDDPRNEFLLGNHDLQYAYPNVYGINCSGFKKDTLALTRQELTLSLWKTMKLVTRQDGWLISHAGVHPNFYVFDDPDRILSRAD